MYTKGEHGYFTGSTSERSAERKASSIHRATSSESKKLSQQTEYRHFYVGQTDVEVAVNPTENDMRRLLRDYGTMRVMRDDAGNVYAWNGDVAIHGQMVSALNPSRGQFGVVTKIEEQGLQDRVNAPIDIIELDRGKPRPTIRPFGSWVKDSDKARSRRAVKQTSDLRRKAAGH